MQLHTALLALIPFVAGATVKSLQSRQSTGACNNSPLLCDRPYNSVVHLGAHDSPFTRDATTGFSASGNQYYNTTIQLSAGVRMLTGQVHRSNGDWHLCHSSCDLLDAGLLSSWLEEIKGWLDANPNDVVTILLVNSDKATPSDLNTHFSNSGIVPQAYIPPSTSAPAEWPTLSSLIQAQKRLLVFVASLDSSTMTSETAYLMDEFAFMFENKYDNTSPTDFSCAPDRPSSVKGNSQAAISANLMPLMNHFLYKEGAFDIESPDRSKLNVTNSPSTTTVGELGFAANQCQTEYGRPPTYILVDFFDEGPAIAAVDALNGVSDPTGRTPVPARNHNADEGGRSDVTFEGVEQLVEQVNNGIKPTVGAWIWAAGKWSLGGINLSGSQQGGVIG
jgi:hypothetical protein